MLFNIAGVETFSKIMSDPTWDLLVVLFFLAFGFFYGLLAGKRKLLAVLFSLYLAIVLFENFSYLDFFIQGRDIFEIFLLRFLVFLSLIILLSGLLGRTVFSGIDKTKKLWQVLILSFLEVGLFMSAVFRLLPAKEFFVFSPVVDALFASEKIFFWWLVLPLAALFLIVRKRKVE